MEIKLETTLFSSKEFLYNKTIEKSLILTIEETNEKKMQKR